MTKKTTARALLLPLHALCVSVALLAGCAEPGLVKPTSAEARPAPEDEVRVRAKARWDAVVVGDWEKAYSFATPAYRQAVDLAGFRGRSAAPVTYKSAEVASVKCEEAACIATMKIGLTPIQRGFGDLSTTVDDRWVFDDGQWWRYDKY